MRSDEIIQSIQQGQKDGKAFIKWWRNENDFTDYELFDNFIARAGSGGEFAGFELLDVDEMWDVLKRWKPTGLRRVHTTMGDRIEWQRRTLDGTLKQQSCSLTPESIMYIFDFETRGDVVG